MFDFIEYSNARCAQLRIVCTGRVGGVSSAPYASLNLGQHVGDSVKDVHQNRTKVESHLGLERSILWLNQTHSVDLVNAKEVRAAFELGDDPLDADGFLCDEALQPCGILTADCLPLVISTADASRFVVLHVGLKGLANGIVEAGVASLLGQGSLSSEGSLSTKDSLWAWAGPCIGPSAFEVGQEVRDALQGPDSAWTQGRMDGAEPKWFCDLYALVGHRLAVVGVKQYEHAQACTFTQADKYFSYRRDGVTGRQATIVWRSNTRAG